MAKDIFGNELGVNAEGTTTFDGRTMAEWRAADEFPAGYYADPEGAIRAEIPGMNGDQPNIGAFHSVATYENGRIVRFSGGATNPRAGGATPGAPYDPNKRAVDVFDARAKATAAIEALAALAGK